MVKSKKKARKAQNKSKQLGAAAVKSTGNEPYVAEQLGASDTSVTDQELESIDVEHDESPTEPPEIDEASEITTPDEPETTDDSTPDEQPSEPTDKTPADLSLPAPSGRKSFFARPLTIISLILALVLIGGLAWGGYVWASKGSLRTYTAAGIPIAKNTPISSPMPVRP